VSSTDPVAVTSAITYTLDTNDCELYFRSQQNHFDGDSIFAFLRDVAEFLPRDVMFILDNLPAHFSALLKMEEGVVIWCQKAPGCSARGLGCGPHSPHSTCGPCGSRRRRATGPFRSTHPGLIPPQPSAVLGFACAPRPSRAFLAHATASNLSTSQLSSTEGYLSVDSRSDHRHRGRLSGWHRSQRQCPVAIGGGLPPTRRCYNSREG